MVLQASFTQPSLSREGGRGGGTEIMETFSLKRNREERRRRQVLKGNEIFFFLFRKIFNSSYN